MNTGAISRAQQGILLPIFLIFACRFCFAGTSGIAPVPENEQAAQALKIIDAYHDPRPATPPKKLHLIYYTPSDRAPEPDYERRLGVIMDDIHDFYRDGMQRLGFGARSFSMDREESGRPLFRLVKGARPDSSFTTWPGRAGTGSPDGGAMVKSDCEAALHSRNPWDHETYLIFCNLANWDEKKKTWRHHSPYFGQYDSAHGLCFAADSVILNLDAITNKSQMLDDEEYGKMSLGKFETIFIGGVAHELGHAFALPHCGAREDEKSLGVSVMGVGNHYYRAELRGETGAFLTMASAMRLASHPLFNGSDKGWGEPAEVKRCDLDLSTNLFRSDLKGSRGALRIEGTVEGSPPIYGVIAYFDRVTDTGWNGGYASPTATSVPDAQGRFAIEISGLKPCNDGLLRLEFCHANGSISTRQLRFVITPEGQADISDWKIRSDLETLAEVVERGDSKQAEIAMEKIQHGDAAELTKNVAQKLAATLKKEPKLSPAVAPAELSQLFLGDARSQSAEVGWLKPSANRIPPGPEVKSPLLECGNLYATGLFAHSPSRYVFDLGGKWKKLRGQAGLHTSFQASANGVVFIIRADGRELFRSGAIRREKIASYDLDVTGVKQLELVVEKAAEQNSYNWALWLDPQLSR